MLVVFVLRDDVTHTFPPPKTFVLAHSAGYLLAMSPGYLDLYAVERAHVSVVL